MVHAAQVVVMNVFKIEPVILQQPYGYVQLAAPASPYNRFRPFSNASATKLSSKGSRNEQKASHVATRRAVTDASRGEGRGGELYAACTDPIEILSGTCRWTTTPPCNNNDHYHTINTLTIDNVQCPCMRCTDYSMPTYEMHPFPV